MNYYEWIEATEALRLWETLEGWRESETGEMRVHYLTYRGLQYRAALKMDGSLEFMQVRPA